MTQIVEQALAVFEEKIARVPITKRLLPVEKLRAFLAARGRFPTLELLQKKQALRQEYREIEQIFQLPASTKLWGKEEEEGRLVYNNRQLVFTVADFHLSGRE